MSNPLKPEQAPGLPSGTGTGGNGQGVNPLAPQATPEEPPEANLYGPLGNLGLALWDGLKQEIHNRKQFLAYLSSPVLGGKMTQDLMAVQQGDTEAQKRMTDAQWGGAAFGADAATFALAPLVLARTVPFRTAGTLAASVGKDVAARVAAYVGIDATAGAVFGALKPLEGNETRAQSIGVNAAVQGVLGPAFGGVIHLAMKPLGALLRSVVPTEIRARFDAMSPAQEQAMYEQAKKIAESVTEDIPIADRPVAQAHAYLTAIDQALNDPNPIMLDDVLTEPTRTSTKARTNARSALDASLERAPRDVALADLPTAESALERTPEFNPKSWRVQEAGQALTDATTPEDRIKAAAVYEQEVARAVAERTRRMESVGTPSGLTSTADEAAGVRPLHETGVVINPDGSVEMSVLRGAGDIGTTSPESMVSGERGKMGTLFEQSRVRFKNPLVVDEWTSPEVLALTSQPVPERLKPVSIQELGPNNESLTYNIGGDRTVEVSIEPPKTKNDPIYINYIGDPIGDVGPRDVGKEVLDGIKRDLALRYPVSNGFVVGERITGSRWGKLTGKMGKFFEEDTSNLSVAQFEKLYQVQTNVRVPLNPRGPEAGTEMSRWLRLQRENISREARLRGHDGVIVRSGRMGEPEIIPLVDGTVTPTRTLNMSDPLVQRVAQVAGGPVEIQQLIERAAQTARRNTPNGMAKFVEMEFDRLRANITESGYIPDIFDGLNKLYQFVEAGVREQEAFADVHGFRDLAFQQEKARTMAEIARNQANEVQFGMTKPEGYQATGVPTDATGSTVSMENVKPRGDPQKVIDAVKIRELAIREWVNNVPWQEVSAPEVIAHKTELEQRLAQFQQMPLFEQRNSEVAAILDAALDENMHKASPTLELGLEYTNQYRMLELDAIGDVKTPRHEAMSKVRNALAGVESSYHPIDTRIAKAFADGIPSPIAPHFGYKVDGTHTQGRSVIESLATVTDEQMNAMLAMAKSVVNLNEKGAVPLHVLGATAGAGTGAVVGAKENEEHPIRGAIEGAALGALLGRGAVRVAQHMGAGESHAARALAGRLGLGAAGLTMEELATRTDDPKYRGILRGVGGFLLWASMADQGWVRGAAQKNSIARVFFKAMYGPAGLMEHQEEAFVRGSNLFNSGAFIGKWTQLKLKAGLSKDVLERTGVEFMEESDPKMHPLWDKITPDEQKLIMTERYGMQVLGQILEKRGLLDQYRENYVRHMLPPETFVTWQGMNPYAGKRPGFTKSRVFPTIMELEAWANKMGVKGPVRDLGALQAAHYREVYKLLSVDGLLQTFSDMGAIRPLGETTMIPKGYRKVKITGREDLVAEDNLARSIETFADRVGYTGTIAQSADVLRSNMMRWINLVSLDHMFNMSRALLSSGVYNPRWLTHASQMINEGTILNEGVRYGLIVHSRPDIVHSLIGSTQEAFEKAGLSSRGAKVAEAITTKNPLVLVLNKVADWQERLLFDHLVPTLNTAIYLKEQHNWIKRTKGMFPPGSAVYEKQMRKIATYANNTVGYMPEMLRGGKAAYIQRQAFFAPTWMQTRMMLVAHAGGDLGAVTRGEMKINDAMYLKAQMRKYLLIGGLTYVMSKVLSGEDPEFSDRTYKYYARTGIYDENKRELGLDFAGWWLDDMKLFNDPWLFARHKASPLISFFDHQFSGRDAFGNAIAGGERLEDFSRSLGSAPAVVSALTRAAQPGEMSDADKLRAAGDISMIGNISTIPNRWDKIGRVHAEKLLRDRGYPLNEDNLHAITSLIVMNMKNGKAWNGNNVQSELQRINNKYKKKSTIYWINQIAAPWIAEHLGME